MSDIDFDNELAKLEQAVAKMSEKIKSGSSEIVTEAFYKVAFEFTVLVENMLPNLRDRADSYLLVNEDDKCHNLHQAINKLEDDLYVIIDFVKKHKNRQLHN